MPTTDIRTKEDFPDGAPLNTPVEIRSVPAWEARVGLALLALLVLTVAVGTWILHHDFLVLETLVSQEVQHDHGNGEVLPK